MVTWARGQFLASRGVTPNASLRAHLKQVSKTTGRPLADLLRANGITDDPPDGMDWLWWVFTKLCGFRPDGLAGVPALPPSEILAWQTLMGIELVPYELEAIYRLDQTFREVMRDGRSSTT